MIDLKDYLLISTIIYSDLSTTFCARFLVQLKPATLNIHQQGNCIDSHDNAFLLFLYRKEKTILIHFSTEQSFEGIWKQDEHNSPLGFRL